MKSRDVEILEFDYEGTLGDQVYGCHARKHADDTAVLAAASVSAAQVGVLIRVTAMFSSAQTLTLKTYEAGDWDLRVLSGTGVDAPVTLIGGRFTVDSTVTR
jgi:hypothetical protein